ncbi:MAG: hypothetical protein AAB425_14265 [Bdellovibrionota bacterium]
MIGKTIEELRRAIAANGLNTGAFRPGAFRLLSEFIWTLIAFGGIVLLVSLFHGSALADVRIPGEDESAKMESVGTLLRFIDTGLFKWGARVLAGLAILSAGWSLKEMRFGAAVISIVSAIIFGTAPTWVKNIFSMSGADSVFSQIDKRVLPGANPAKETRRA